MEIERKWLLKKIPSIPASRKYWIEQFYIDIDPEVRLRRCEPNGDYENDIPYRMTLKGEGDLSRSEVETAITEEFYNDALDMVNKDPIQKHFLCYDDIDGHLVEVSVVLGDKGFVYAEVEFESEEEANAYEFPWPEIVEREVTKEYKYKMAYYWKATRITGECWPPEKPTSGGYYF